jgi:hypothetical protein
VWRALDQGAWVNSPRYSDFGQKSGTDSPVDVGDKAAGGTELPARATDNGLNDSKTFSHMK